MSLWRAMFLAERYGRIRLTLDEVSEQIGLAPSTIRNRRSRGDFTWLVVDGRKLFADVMDVAQYLESQRRPDGTPLVLRSEFEKTQSARAAGPRWSR